jgi:hypothetical protein
MRPLSCCIFTVFLFFGSTVLTTAEEFPPLFPFNVDYQLEKGSAVDASPLLAAPAGKHGFIRCGTGNFAGRFVHNGGEFKIYGTNFSGNANFPSKEYADKTAERLASLGINCVRFHWMDGYAIWGNSPKSLRKIDPDQLDKLDYAIAALKKRGIYTNLNLHVSRWLDDRDGFPHKDKRPDYDKGLDNFEPRMVELQKEYAKDLLTHKNPYTGLTYSDEPAIAVIEINNENSVMSEWANGKLDDLPDPYGNEFQKQWNDYLKAKYKSTEAMLEAWQCRNYPLGEEMLDGGNFTEEIEFNKKNWVIQLDDEKQASCKSIPEEKLLRLAVYRDGKVSWTPQLYYRGLKIEKDKPYTLSFKVRSNTANKEPFKMYVSVYLDKEPWTPLGMRSAVETTSKWKTFTYRFYAAEDGGSFGRISFGGLKTGEFEFVDVSLRSGGEFGLPENCTLEKGNIPLIKNTVQPLCTEAYKDFWRFLMDIEKKYWGGMYHYIKNELKAKQPVSGTQLYYGSKLVQSELDYCDDHAYWNHPAWGIKRWDSEDWYIRNRALVNWADSSILPVLAPRRIADKPYTVSEYNHPFPNQFAAEGLLMLAAFSGFQDWSGIFQYTYAHKADDEPKQFTGYFDMIAQTGQLVHSAACSNMILRGDVSEGKQTVFGYLNTDGEIEALSKLRYPSLVGASELGYTDRRLALLHKVATRAGDVNPPITDTTRAEGVNEQSEFVSDTKELTWNVGSGKATEKPEERDAGYFTLNTPKTKVFTGFIKGRHFNIGGVQLDFGKTRLDWATVSLTETKKNRYLLAVSGYMENKGMKFEQYDTVNPNNKDRMTLHKNWGTEPVMCEGIPLTVTLPPAPLFENVKCFALDAAGKRKQDIPAAAENRRAVIVLKPADQTLWYEIVAER